MRAATGTDPLVDGIVEAFGDHPLVQPHGPHALTGLRISHRWEGRVVLLLFGRRPRPALVAKLDRSPRHAPRLDQELAALHELEADGRFTGLVPRPVGAADLAQGRVMVQTGLGGSPLTAVLRRRSARSRRRRAPQDHELLHGWLQRLQAWDGPGDPGATTIELGDLHERVRAAVGPDLAVAADRWLDRLRAAAHGADDIRVPRHRGHGDLGPSNLLLDHDELRLVDWEADTGAQLRLPDTVVALNHYVRATPLSAGRLPTRSQAAVRAFLADEELGRLTRRSWDRALSSLRLPVEAADLLLVDGLVRLATGRAATAHHARGQRMWTAVLQALVGELAQRGELWPPTR